MQYFRLNNGCIERVIEISEHGVRSVSLTDLNNGVNFVRTPVREFAFSIDDVFMTSYQESKVREVDGNRDQIGSAPVFQSARQDPRSLELDFTMGPVQVTVVYKIYPGLCGTRKHLKIRNLQSAPVRLSNLAFDDTCAEPGEFCDCDLYAGCGDHPDRAGFSEKQLGYLQNRLMTLPSGHTAIVLTHICPLNSAMWRNYPVRDSLARFPELTGLLTGFVHSGGKLAGVFSGDSHFDYFDSVDGVNYFVTQGCGGVGPKELPPQGRVYHQFSEQLGRGDTFDSTEHCLIDLAAVKTEKREVRIFRLGAGGFYFHCGAKF